MKLAQSSAVYFNYSLQYAIQDLHRLGYDGIEIWGGRPHMYRSDLDEQIEEICDLLHSLNMEVCNYIPAQFRYPSLLCSDNETVRSDSVEYIKSGIDNALKVNAPSVSLCPGVFPFDGNAQTGWSQLVISMREIAEYCQNKDIFLLIEPAHRFESNIILTVEDALRMLDQLKSERFGILLDTGHCMVNGEDFRSIVPKCKGIPFHIHLDDNNGDADSHLIPGRGSIEFISLKRALDEINYQGFLSGELGSIYTMNPTSACKETLDFLNQHFLS
jgi:protein FrlC